MKLINRILNETTCEGKTLDIYIEPANDTDMNDIRKILDFINNYLRV